MTTLPPDNLLHTGFQSSNSSLRRIKACFMILVSVPCIHQQKLRTFLKRTLRITTCPAYPSTRTPLDVRQYLTEI
jgi:hypothetical protein